MSKLTQAARGQPCIRCGVNDGTVVAAHLNGPLAALLGRGMAQKPHDLFCADLCHRCHDILDGRRTSSELLNPDHKEKQWAEYVLLTIKRRIDGGVICRTTG